MDSQALFDEEEKPLESLKVYDLIKYGNEITPFEDGVEDISVNPIDFTTFSLPTTISVIYINEEKETKSFTWDDDFDLNKVKNDEAYVYNGKGDNINIDIKCIFENNSKNIEKRFVYSYYIEINLYFIFAQKLSYSIISSKIQFNQELKNLKYYL